MPFKKNFNGPETAAVIGAGTSGLVAAKYLLHSGGLKKVRIFEKETGIGGVFQYGVWKGAEMVSSKYVTSFSDFTMDEWWTEEKRPGPCPMHMSTADFSSYLVAYAKKFDVYDKIEFSTLVTNVKEHGDAEGFSVTIAPCPTASAPPAGDVKKHKKRKGHNSGSGEETIHVDMVLVCSGLHHNPRIPDIWAPFITKDRSDENTSSHADRTATSESSVNAYPTVIHSQDYKSTAQVKPTDRVLILGGGETSHDIAAQVVQAGCAKVTMSKGKDGFIAVPKEMFGKAPLDIFITNAFEHFGVHDWIQKSHLRWHCMTPFIRAGFLITTGSSWGFNQWTGRKKQVQRGRHFIMKTGKALPYLNRPAQEQSLCKGYPWRLLFGTADRSIYSKPMVRHVMRTKTQTTSSPAGGNEVSAPAPYDGPVLVTFDDGSTEEFDRVILCTGYDPQFPFLEEPEKHVWPPEVRNITSPNRHSPRLGFIGFVRPNVGAIPPMAELQAMWFVHFNCLLQKKLEEEGVTNDSSLTPEVTIRQHIRSLPPPRYNLLSQAKAIVQYGTDFGMYMFQVGEDMEACPNIRRLLLEERDWRVFLVLTFGQAYTQLFRIHGPFQDPHATATARSLVQTTIYSRGIVSNTIFLVLGLFFGWLNLVCYTITFALRLAGHGVEDMHLSKTGGGLTG